MSDRQPNASMNEANERDPFNNNSYGTLVDSGYKPVELPVLDVDDFNDRIIRGYEEGYGEIPISWPFWLLLCLSIIIMGFTVAGTHQDGKETYYVVGMVMALIILAVTLMMAAKAFFPVLFVAWIIPVGLFALLGIGVEDY